MRCTMAPRLCVLLLHLCLAALRQVSSSSFEVTSARIFQFTCENQAICIECRAFYVAAVPGQRTTWRVEGIKISMLLLCTELRKPSSTWDGRVSRIPDSRDLEIYASRASSYLQCGLCSLRSISSLRTLCGCRTFYSELAAFQLLRKNLCLLAIMREQVFLRSSSSHTPRTDSADTANTKKNINSMTHICFHRSRNASPQTAASFFQLMVP
jgi:hypothetical protein